MTGSGGDGWTQMQIEFGSGGAREAEYQQGDVCRYTGASARQLDHWATKGILGPSIREAAGHGTRRIYSFRDVLAVRMVKRLTDAGISLEKMSRAVETLRRLGEAELASTVLVTDGGTVYQCRSDHEVIDLLRGGQGVITIVVSHVLTDLLAAIPTPAPVAELGATKVRPRAEGHRRRRGIA